MVVVTFVLYEWHVLVGKKGMEIRRILQFDRSADLTWNVAILGWSIVLSYNFHMVSSSTDNHQPDVLSFHDFRSHSEKHGCEWISNLHQSCQSLKLTSNTSRKRLKTWALGLQQIDFFRSFNRYNLWDPKESANRQRVFSIQHSIAPINHKSFSGFMTDGSILQPNQLQNFTFEPVWKNECGLF